MSPNDLTADTRRLRLNELRESLTKPLEVKQHHVLQSHSDQLQLLSQRISNIEGHLKIIDDRFKLMDERLKLMKGWK